MKGYYLKKYWANITKEPMIGGSNNYADFLSGMEPSDYQSDWYAGLKRSCLADLFDELPYSMHRSLEDKVKEASGADRVETVEEYLARGGKISGCD
jgi:hypothetical protein